MSAFPFVSFMPSVLLALKLLDPPTSLPSMPQQLTHLSESTSASNNLEDLPVTSEQVGEGCWKLIKRLPSDQQCTVLSNLVDKYLKLSSTLKNVPKDFLQLSVSGMCHLAECGRSNVIYLLVKSLGTMRPDKSDSLLPAKRMPMGLIEHCVNFYNCTSVNQV